MVITISSSMSVKPDADWRVRFKFVGPQGLMPVPCQNNYQVLYLVPSSAVPSDFE